ncbi:hypothetical protein [Streptomyces sp. CB02009]|uniref:hypothetical protein n=1 Tax=Streptomyces sp. CB02009 TaxID=1703938 RepID=UPI000A805E1F|nr:hypothetical protein [Streptomyces sp. CB02009]
MVHGATLVLAKKILNTPVGDILASVEALRVAGQQDLHATQDEAAGTKASQTDDSIEVLRVAHEADTELGQKIEQVSPPLRSEPLPRQPSKPQERPPHSRQRTRPVEA